MVATQSLVEKIPAAGLTPISLVRRLSPQGPLAIWESSQSKLQSETVIGHQAARFTAIAIQPRKVLRIGQGVADFCVGAITKQLSYTDPIQLIRECFSEELQCSTMNLGPPFPFGGGVLGFCSYDMAAGTERIRGMKVHPDLPLAYFLVTESTIVFDREEETIYVVSSPIPTADSQQRFLDLVTSIRSLTFSPIETPSGVPPLGALPSAHEQFSKQQFIDRVRRAKEYIAAGDVFQVVLANSFDAATSVDPLTLYDNLRNFNPSPFHFLFRFEEHCLVGASPEVYLRGGQLRTAKQADGRKAVAMRLVAGTYPKQNALSLEQLAKDLLSDNKERAEHLMLVDHARNDLGRVAEIGSVKVDDLFSVETYADVHHLVSEVSAVLRRDSDILSALESCFPIATLTGTPKIRAMEIISELEETPRGLFGGSAIALNYGGMLDSAVIIRSALVEKDFIRVQAGAGIVWDSVPEREYEECRWKAKAIFDALQGARRP